MNASILTASHYGVVHFGDLDCEAVVLTTGERGYVRKELAKLLGFHESHKGGRFARFLADIAPNSLSLLEKSSGQILLPSGRQTQFFPTGIIADVATSVVDAAIAGTLHRARQGIVGNCLTIMRALATTGEVALIDEATGYQHHRAPDALQELISKLLRQSCASWERRFHPDYYRHLSVVRLEVPGPRPEPSARRRPDHAALGLRAGAARRLAGRDPQSQRHLAEAPPVAVRSGTSAFGIADSRGHGDCAQLDELSRLQAPLRGRLCWRCPAVGPAAR